MTKLREGDRVMARGVVRNVDQDGDVWFTPDGTSYACCVEPSALTPDPPAEPEDEAIALYDFHGLMQEELALLEMDQRIADRLAQPLFLRLRLRLRPAPPAEPVNAQMLAALRKAQHTLDGLMGDTDPSDPDDKTLLTCQAVSAAITAAEAAMDAHADEPAKPGSAYRKGDYWDAGYQAGLRDATPAIPPDLAAALRPLVRALEAFEAQFTPQELAALDYGTHLIGAGISLADCRRAKALLAADRSGILAQDAPKATEARGSIGFNQYGEPI